MDLHPPVGKFLDTFHAREVHNRAAVNPNELLARHCGRKVEDITRDTDRDRFMSAEEAKEYGLVDQVVASRREIGPLTEKKPGLAP